MDAADQVLGRMRPLLLLQAAGFLAWQAGDGIAGGLSAPSTGLPPAIMISLAGAMVWLVSLLAYFYLAWQAKKDGIYDILNDEWAQHVRKRASETAFWVLMISVVASMTASKFGVDAAMLLQVNVGISVASYFIATVWFDSRNEGAE